MAEAVDRAGNVGRATATLTVHHPNSISAANSSFALDSSGASGCVPSKATVTLRDASNNAVTGRLVAIRPEAHRDGSPSSEEVFFTGAMPQGDVIVVSTDDVGEIIFPAQGLTTTITPATVGCKYVSYPAGSPVEVSIGSPHSLTTSSPTCADAVDADNSSIAIVGQPRVCVPFFIEVTLKDGSDQPLEDGSVGLLAESDRNQGGKRVDFFFDRDGPQDTFIPVHTGSETASDSVGKILISVYATERGITSEGTGPTYTVKLRQSTSDVQIGSVGPIDVGSACGDLPNATHSTITVTPSTIGSGSPPAPSEVAYLQITLRDDSGQPIPHTTFAIQPRSDRNDSNGSGVYMSEVFGDPPTPHTDYIALLTTDANGVVSPPPSVRSIDPTGGPVDLGVEVLSPFGDAEISGGATLTVESVPADLIDPSTSTVLFAPNQDHPGVNVQGTITLRDQAGAPLPNALVGLWITTDRNDTPATPYSVDHVFAQGQLAAALPAPLPDEVVPLMTDKAGKLPVSLTSHQPGTALVTVNALTSVGLIPVAEDVVTYAACPFEDENHCQSLETSPSVLSTCDRYVGRDFMCADDFAALTSGELQRVCWWPGFVPTTGNPECSDPGLTPPGYWTLRMFKDLGGIPDEGAEIGPVGGQDLVVDMSAPAYGRIW